MVFSAHEIKTLALELGFNLVGITTAWPSPHLDAYLRWIEAGMHGEMGYLARPDRIQRRQDLSVMVPSARSLVVVGLDYAPSLPHSSDPAHGRIAVYAWGSDYHDIMMPRLEKLAARIGAGAHRAYVDTGALLERSHAHQAGLGFTGKNTMLIHPRRGSMFFLGEIITTEEVDRYDTPGHSSMCGNCIRCLNACPTNAFPQPYVLDARRCISYLTIEHKGWIPHELRPRMGNWVYGCDICQEVCPFQRFAFPTHEPELQPPDDAFFSPHLLELLTLTGAHFSVRYARSPILRIKRDRLVRNACIAAGNWGSPQAFTALANLLQDSSSLVRGHAAWALGQLKLPQSRAALSSRLHTENDSQVMTEIRVALET